MMYYTWISKKQIGVIFSNWKKGNLNLTEEQVNFLYKECAEVKGLNFNHNFDDVLQRVKYAVDCIFANNFSEAEKSINSAYRLYHTIYK